MTSGLSGRDLQGADWEGHCLHGRSSTAFTKLFVDDGVFSDALCRLQVTAFAGQTSAPPSGIGQSAYAAGRPISRKVP
jgi:hypothetical protein